MAPKQTSGSVVSSAEIDDVRAAIVSGLRLNGIDVVLVERDYIEFRRGSQAAYRLKGAMLCSPEEMPIVGGCRLLATDDRRTRCEITVRDEHAFGLRMGTNKKFDAAISNATQLVIALAAAAQPSTHHNQKEQETDEQPQ